MSVNKRKSRSASTSDDPCVSTFSLQGLSQPGSSSNQNSDSKAVQSEAPLPTDSSPSVASSSAAQAEGFRFKKLRVASVEKKLPLPFTMPSRKRGISEVDRAWRVMQDPVSGRAFWHNQQTQESRWTRAGVPPAAFDVKAALNQARNSSDQDATRGATGAGASHKHGLEGDPEGDDDCGDDGDEEFFCDACDKTVPLCALGEQQAGEHRGLYTRYECAICPGEFLLCGKCYVNVKACDRGHALYRSTAREHISRVLDKEARARDTQ